MAMQHMYQATSATNRSGLWSCWVEVSCATLHLHPRPQARTWAQGPSAGSETPLPAAELPPPLLLPSPPPLLWPLTRPPVPLPPPLLALLNALRRCRLSPPASI
jgi:hypothetical protein